MTSVHHLFKSLLLLSVLTTMIFPGAAQPSDEPPIITAENITQLQSVATIDFADYPELSAMATGWFTSNKQGDLYAIADTTEQIFIVSLDGTISTVSYGEVNEELGHSVIDVKFGTLNDDTIIVTLVQINLRTKDIDTGEESMLASAQMSYHSVDGKTALEEPIDIDLLMGYSGRAIWLTPDDTDNENFQVHLEASDIRSSAIRDVIISWTPFADVEEYSYEEIPYAPASAVESSVRIGRIVPPIAITASFEGLVKRWDLEAGEITAEAQVEGGSAVFGQINASGSHFAWRDPLSENINLLNFETGENQVVAPLDGEYFNWFFVSQDASVILGVTPEERPEIVAWIVETGERILVGEYRECSRQPDMVRLSKVGTTLVIGCNTGLDIWRVVND